jgi:urea transport system permease protein
MGMYLMRQIGDRGVYGDPVLPDFMVFLNWQELPWFWYGFDMFWFAALMVVLVPGLLAFVFGWLAFRSRVTGVYLSIITQALTYALMLAFFRNEMGFGGNNGLTDFKDILGFDLQADTPARAVRWPRRWRWRWAISPAAGSSPPGSARCWSPCATRKAGCASSATGSTLQARSSGPSRRCSPGIAGALYVPQVGIINPGEFAPPTPSSWSSGSPSAGADAGRRGHRRGSRQLRQDLVHRRLPEASGCSRSAGCSCW